MQLASMNAFYSIWLLENITFYKSLLRDFFNRDIVAFLETSVLKEVRILRYLHSNSAVLLPKFPNKILYSTK